MKNIKRVLYAILFACTILGEPLMAQKNLSDIKIEISDDTIYRDNSIVKYVNLYRYKIRVNQTVTIRNKCDTLALKLECPSYLNNALLNLFFHNLKVTSTINNNSVDIPFKFDGETLLIDKKSDKICITYEYQPDFILRNQGDASTYILPSIQDWHSWYFTSQDMVIRSFKASTIENSYLITNINKGSIDKSAKIDLRNKDQKAISFFVLTKPLYVKQSYDLDNTHLEVYEMNRYCLDSVFNSTKGRYRIDFKPISMPTAQKIKTDKLNEDIHTLSKFFSTKKNKKSITIIEIPSNIELGDDNILWGRAYNTGKSSHLAIIDSSFWFNNSLMHELLHIYTADNRIKKDSTCYLLSESFIEYLSVCLKYKEPQIRDSIFQEKHTRYTKSNKAYSSIFRTTENVAYGGDTCSSSDLIYLEIPYRLYCFSKSIGEAKFMRAIQEMYSKKDIDLITLERLLIKNGVFKSDWDAFIQSI